MWPLSLLLLHTKLRKKFPSFVPLLEEFTLGDENANTNNVTRTNIHNHNYKLFKATALSKYSAELHKQNELGMIIFYYNHYNYHHHIIITKDVLLYQKALEIFCNELWENELWQYKIVRDYWKEKAIMISNNSGNRCIT